MLLHNFVSAKPDGADTTKLRPSDWNAEHVFGGGVHGDVLVRSTSASKGGVWSSELASVTPSLWFNYAAWGDSLTAGANGATPYPTTLAPLTGQTIYNGGVGGETSTQIKVRMLADTARQGNFVIIWAGRNNFTDPTTVKADIAAMVASLSHSRYLILSVLNQDSATEYSGQTNYNTLIQLNTDLAALYPNNYLDVRAYLVSQYNSGLPQDVVDHGRDIPPSSLRSDAVHLNTAGNTLVANYVFAWLAAHDFCARAVARLSDVLGMFATPPAINSSSALRWGSSGTSASDIGLVRVAAQTLGVQSGALSQAFEVYEGFSDTSNYGRLRFVSRPANADYAIYTDRIGTFVARSLSFGAAGNVQWRILTTGHLVAVTDNASDIGASGATRPRNVFIAGDITTGSTTLHKTSVALTNGAAAAAGTLTNAPTAGNPTKWVPINDNGTTRYIPAW